jgi:hypothetical protein
MQLATFRSIRGGERWFRDAVPNDMPSLDFKNYTNINLLWSPIEFHW